MPTIDEDLARLEARLIERCQCGGCRSDREALTRIRAALADREHLELAALLLRAGQGQFERGFIGEYGAKFAEWIEAERLRQSGKGGA